MRNIIPTMLAVAMFACPAVAEEASYGDIELTGLARESWPLNPLGESQAMVCNVGGPDGYLTVFDQPSTNGPFARKLNRLAVLVVDTADRQGNWIRVTGAYRNHSKTGERLPATKALPVTGWADDNYLCDFLD